MRASALGQTSVPMASLPSANRCARRALMLRTKKTARRRSLFGLDIEAKRESFVLRFIVATSCLLVPQFAQNGQ
jgi:hypothetical protein